MHANWIQIGVHVLCALEFLKLAITTNGVECVLTSFHKYAALEVAA